MNKEHFKTLLEDLYDKYNHSRKSEVTNLIDKYNGQEFDAIKTFYFKYNFKSHPSYNIKAGTDSHIKGLIESYSNGKRPIKDTVNINPEEERLSAIKKETEQASSEINSVSETKKEELLKLADEKIKSLEIMIQDKEKTLEQMIKKMDNMIQEKAQKIEEKIKKISEESIELLTASNKNAKIENDEHVELKINLDYTETDIELPKEVSFMAAGTRFLMVDQNKQMLAFEIKEIFFDYVSFPGKCIREINIQRI